MKCLRKFYWSIVELQCCVSFSCTSVESVYSYIWVSQVALVVKNTCQFRRHKRHRFNPCIQKIWWRRAQQPTPSKNTWTEDRGAWKAIVHTVAQSWTWIKILSTHPQISINTNTCTHFFRLFSHICHYRVLEFPVLYWKFSLVIYFYIAVCMKLESCF